MHIFRHIFLSNYSWQESDIWSQVSYRYAILWEAFLNPSDSYFLFADLVDFYTHWTYILYMTIFSRIFLSNYWLQKSDIWSQALYRYPISWESFFDPSDSYFLFTEERGYHKWALAHSSSCWLLEAVATCLLPTTSIIFSLREEYYILPTWRVLYSPYVKSIIFSIHEEYYILHTWRVLYSPYVKSIIFSIREVLLYELCIWFVLYTSWCLFQLGCTCT
jgi:hypothetical protein